MGKNKKNKKNKKIHINKRNFKGNKSASPIRGSLTPFRGSVLENRYNEVMRSRIALTAAMGDIREFMKDGAAVLLRHALKTTNRNLYIPASARQIIYAKILASKNHYVASFVNCALEYINNDRIPRLELNLSEYKPKEKNKAVTLACRCIEKANEGYILPILKRLNEHYWGDFPGSDVMRDKFKAIDSALHVVCDFFLKYYKGELPKSISAQVYSGALAHDSKISHLYTLASHDTYKATKRHIPYTAVTLDCAAYLIIE